jgi:hypothetical protein
MNSPIQIEAMKKSNLKAKIHEKNLYHLIYNNFLTNNIDPSYINKITDYIKNNSYITTMVPSISKKNTPYISIFEIFIENPKLKNIYEINNNNHTYLTTRTKTENLLFHNIYNGCDAQLKPKYGSINIIKNIGGDPLCKWYGDICLKYKDNIKVRVTFTFGDSFGGMMYLCTYKYLQHILYHFDKKTLDNLIGIVDGKKSTGNTQYIEAQIHGDVDISKDVESIHIPNKVYEQDKFNIDKFQKLYPNIEILIY